MPYLIEYTDTIQHREAQPHARAQKMNVRHWTILLRYPTVGRCKSAMPRAAVTVDNMEIALLGRMDRGEPDDPEDACTENMVAESPKSRSSRSGYVIGINCR